MELIVRPDAERDLAEAADWYLKREYYLKNKFISRIDSLLERIIRNPRQFPYAKEKLRRASVRDFPYSVYYRAEENKVIVFAILHHIRDLSALDERLN